MTRLNKHWNQEEKDFVYDVWGEMTIKQIAKHLNRNVCSVVRFSEKEQLGGAVFNDMFLTTVEASKIISVDPTTVLTWIKKNKLKAKKRPMKKRKVYLIDPQDFRDFLRKNQDKWNATKLQEGFFDENQCDWLLVKKVEDSKPIVAKRNCAWTVKEQLKLQDLASKGLTNKEIATILDRTPLSVQRKRTRLRELGECC